MMNIFVIFLDRFVIWQNSDNAVPVIKERAGRR